MKPSPIDTERYVERAVALFKEGYNCSQAVFVAYSDLFAIDPTLAATLTGSFGGGMGRLREVCGAVSGMFMVAGLEFPAADPTDKEAKKNNYTVVQELAGAFTAENGAIVCRTLLGLGDEKQPPVPEERTPAYYRKRPCAEYVACAARLVGEKINEHRQ